MRNNFIKVNLIIFVFLFCTSQQIFAVQEGPLIDRGDGYAVGAPTPIKDSSETLNDFMSIFFRGFDTNSIDLGGPIPNVTGQPSQQNSGWNSTSPISTDSIIPFRQCNYRNVNMVQGQSNCTMCNAGCGPTAAAIMLSVFGIQDSPPNVLQRYRTFNSYITCKGTSLEGAKKVLESYGLTTSQYIFSSNGGFRIEDVADDIQLKVKNGWAVFALLHFCEGGCGHFVTITDISGNRIVTSYDPYYEINPPTQPINYSQRYPFPKYIGAFGVKK